jgi:transposase
MPVSEAECVRQVAVRARQADVARAQGISPALLGTACSKAVLSRAEREEIKLIRATLKLVDIERGILNGDHFSQP